VRRYYVCIACTKSKSKARYQIEHARHQGSIKELPYCSQCGTLLCPENWYPSQIKRGQRTCVSCQSKISQTGYQKHSAARKQKASGYYYANKEEVQMGNRAYHWAHRDELLQQKRVRWDKTKEQVNSARRLNYANDVEYRSAALQRNNVSRETYRSVTLQRNKNTRDQLKLQVIQHYSPGMKCIKCQFADIRALAVDHVNGGGKKHVKEIGGVGRFYRWLVEHNFPEGFQVLCMNCNMLKRWENGEHNHYPTLLEAGYVFKTSVSERANDREDSFVLRLTVLLHYSPFLICTKCCASNYRLLTIDHKERLPRSGRNSESGKRLLLKLKRENYPDGFQVLCYNCQWIKRHENHEWHKIYIDRELRQLEVV
jgi:hypothetical protein